MHTLRLFWGASEAVNGVGFCVPFPIYTGEDHLTSLGTATTF